MSAVYQELLQGEPHLRPPPGERHERICRRLHTLMEASVDGMRGTRLLPTRHPVELSNELVLCPDLALIAASTGKLWLAVEIIDRYDHHLDTVVKKMIYEDIRVPRLWMIDPRYDNVEDYHASPYGLTCQRMLAGRDVLSEELIPEFQVQMNDLFA